MKVLTFSRVRDRRLVALLAAAAAAAAAPTIGDAAAPDTTTTSVTVEFADLDLSTEAGAHTLYRRIRTAALDVCGRPEFRNREMNELRSACVDQAVAEAVARMNRARLSSLHEKESRARS